LELLRFGVSELLRSSTASGSTPTVVDGILDDLETAIRVQRLRARIPSAS
jgi:hypothetical protein